MIYGYVRVSTKNKLKENSLEKQTDTLKINGCQEITIGQYTGTTTDKPKFHELIAQHGSLFFCNILAKCFHLLDNRQNGKQGVQFN